MVDKAGSAQLGIDIGGTFTDIVLLASDGTLHVKKVPSTPIDPGQAIISGLRSLLADIGISADRVGEIIHGTTVGTNTILEQKGARTGLLTTRGFRDVLEIARLRRPTLFDLDWEKPVPLVERRHRLEVEERMGADGQVVRPLDEASVVRAAQRLARAGIESVAICLLNSYRNPVHEEAVERILNEQFPHLYVSTSHKVLAEIKEYERTSTTVVNAYILPKLRDYISNLQKSLREIGVNAPLLIVASNGGVMGADLAAEKPVHIVASGPAAGVTGSAKLAGLMDMPNIITFDMGGTTAKAALVEGGELTRTAEFEVRAGLSASSRYVRAGGYLIMVPAVDVAEVGAGGGSIAWIDQGGALQVGPQSAGADPGPVCYGQGGEEPTITDANVVLGYLNPHYLVGGALRLDKERAENAIRRSIAEPLGLSIIEAAYGIRAVANANMVRAVRAVTVERGRDPRDFSLFAFGGSGPVHAADIASALGIGQVVVPLLPGVFTALGPLACDVQHHFVRTHMGALGRFAVADLNTSLQHMAAEATATLQTEGYTGKRTELKFYADLRYLGQASELRMPLSNGSLTPESLAELEAEFHREYLRTYGYSSSGEPVELVNLWLVAVGLRTSVPRFNRLKLHMPPAVDEVSSRPVYLGRELGFGDAPVYHRSALGQKRIEGPAVIESYESTIVVPVGAAAYIDSFHNVIIDI